jgi:hypothetical protein
MRLMKEIGRLQTSPPEGIRVQADEDNMMDLIGMIAGPGAFAYSACARVRLADCSWRCYRGYAIRRRLLQDQVRVRARVSRSSSQVYVEFSRAHLLLSIPSRS